MQPIDYERAVCELAHRIAKDALPEDKYIHTCRVVNYTEEICARESISGDTHSLCIVLALLHDVIEDSDVTYDDIEDAFGTHVANCVDVLTHIKEKETYEDYIDRIFLSVHPVQIVKRADMKDHLLQKETLTPKLKEKYLGVLDKFM